MPCCVRVVSADHGGIARVGASNGQLVAGVVVVGGLPDLNGLARLEEVEEALLVPTAAA